MSVESLDLSYDLLLFLFMAVLFVFLVVYVVEYGVFARAASWIVVLVFFPLQKVDRSVCLACLDACVTRFLGLFFSSFFMPFTKHLFIFVSRLSFFSRFLLTPVLSSICIWHDRWPFSFIAG